MNSPDAVRAFTPDGLPHSDICGSMAMCASPQLFAACHVLHRLMVPRHSPCALCNLTILTCVVLHPVCMRMPGVVFVPSRSRHKLLKRSQDSQGSLARTRRFLSTFAATAFLQNNCRHARPLSSRFYRFFCFFVFNLLSRLYTVFKVRAVPYGTTVRTKRAGGDNEDRTRDLLLARQALSQAELCPRLASPQGSGP